MPKPRDYKDHFDKVFWYVAGGSIFVSAYVVAVTFLYIPKENLRFVDTCLGFLLGTVMGNGINYLVGGNAPQHKKEEPTITQTGNTITNNTEVLPPADETEL